MTTTFGITCNFWSRDFGTGIVIILVSLTNIWNSFEGQRNVSLSNCWSELKVHVLALWEPDLNWAEPELRGWDSTLVGNSAKSSGREETHACAQITYDGNRICKAPLITFVNRGFNAHISLLIFHRTLLFFCTSTLWASTDTFSESHLIRDESSTPWWFRGRGSSCHESRCTQHSLPWQPRVRQSSQEELISDLLSDFQINILNV